MAPPCYSSPAPLPLPNLAKSPSRLLPTRGANRHLASPCTRYTSPPSPHTNTHTATHHTPRTASRDTIRRHHTPPHFATQPLHRFPRTRYTSPPSPHTNTHTATQPHSPYRLSRHHQTPPHTPTLHHTHTQPNRAANAQPERHEALHLLGTLIQTVPGLNRQPHERSASARSENASASSRQKGSPTNDST